MKLCKRCEKNRAVIKFCDPCAREISRAHDSVMQRADAAVGYLRSVKPAHTGRNLPNEQSYKMFETFAFLSVFHPEISEDRAIQIADSVRKVR